MSVLEVIEQVSGVVNGFIGYDRDHFGGQICEQWPRPHWLGVGLAYPALRSKCILDQLVCIICRGFANRSAMAGGSPGPHEFAGLLQYIEYCAGTAALSKALIEAGPRLQLRHHLRRAARHVVCKRPATFFGCCDSFSRKCFALVGHEVQFLCDAVPCEQHPMTGKATG